MQQYLQKVPLRKGELVIWDTGQVHCNFANYSNHPRLYQFIRMLPATQENQDEDKFSPRRIMKEKKYRDIDFSIITDPIGRKLVGLDEW